MTRTAWLTKIPVIVFALVSLPGAVIIAGARDSGLRQTPAATEQQSKPQRTVWDGVYSEKQAQRGARAYQQLCGRCHRENLEGEAEAPALIGTPFLDRWRYLSAQDLFFAIQITMSHSHELFEPSDRVADVVSFMLRANKMPAGAGELPVNPEELRQILIIDKPAAH